MEDLHIFGIAEWLPKLHPECCLIATVIASTHYWESKKRYKKTSVDDRSRRSFREMQGKFSKRSFIVLSWLVKTNGTDDWCFGYSGRSNYTTICRRRMATAWVLLAEIFSLTEKVFCLRSRVNSHEISGADFPHLVEGREFTIYTDHRPLTYALNSNSNHLSHEEQYLHFEFR